MLPLDSGPAFIRAFLIWYEDHILKADTSRISIEKPVFLFGLPRSGTTILQNILCSHDSAAYITNSMHQFGKSIIAIEHFRKLLRLDFEGQRYIKDGLMVGPGSPNEGIAIFADWFKLDPFSTSYKDLNIDQFSQSEINDGLEILKKVIWSFGRNGKRFFNKCPGLFVQVLFFLQIFPDAKFIHLIRDARMCANSMIKLYKRNVLQENKIKATYPNLLRPEQSVVPYPHLPKLEEYLEAYGPEDIQTTANLWNDGVSFLVDKRNQIPDLFEVRYEDILENPQGEITKILKFCEFPAIKDPKSRFWQMVETFKPVHANRQYGDFDIIESICSVNMKRYGYL
jgi:hypothetical protein